MPKGYYVLIILHSVTRSLKIKRLLNYLMGKTYKDVLILFFFFQSIIINFLLILKNQQVKAWKDFRLYTVPTLTPVSYTHLRAHETDSYLVCRLLLEKKKNASLFAR
eukprot:TRINITY_DN80_c0_g1_i17.p3 TRINITY_DN80_c0_g1~~TRINITY_DN80_c0_g1_i17.p3  ORF type:complete len:107 (-),score=4.55 TRINITY_DN80_c0_g1_i17:12-332(-)